MLVQVLLLGAQQNMCNLGFEISSEVGRKKASEVGRKKVGRSGHHSNVQGQGHEQEPLPSVSTLGL